MRAVALAFAAFAALLTAPLLAQDFPALSGRVVDEADVLSDTFEQRLVARLEALEADTTVNFVVMTVPSLGDASPEEIADGFLDQWVGANPPGDNSAILLLVPDDRTFIVQVRMQLDPELYEGRPDAYWFEKGTLPPSRVKKLKVIIEQAVVPGFKEGDWERGLNDGINALEMTLRAPPPPSKASKDIEES